ncbi:MAG: radical SAM protein [Clostridia bacterium]|nr:radical SAM protein [Clostridia bacterium]
MDIQISYNKENNEFLVPEGAQMGFSNLMWHITEECNLSCEHCFSRKGKCSFDISNLNSYIKSFKELGVIKVDLSGGEPLLYEDLEVLCKALFFNGFYFTITTSAYVSSDKMRWLLDNSALFSRIILSLNAPNATIHERINHVTGSFQHVIDCANALSSRRVSFRINTVCTESICTDDVAKSFVQLINSIRPREWCVIQEYGDKEEKTATVFSSFLKLVLSYRLLPNIRLITRSQSTYSNYPVLEANGTLYFRKNNNRTTMIGNKNIKSILGALI